MKRARNVVWASCTFLLTLGACAARSPGPPPPAVGAPVTPSGAAFQERAGTLCLEAEHGEGDWSIAHDPETSSGRYINDPGAGRVRYQLRFASAGRWYIYLRARKGENTPAGDDENDVRVRIDGQRLYGSDDTTRPEGMRINKPGWGWTHLPKGPGGHTPSNIKQGHVYARVEKPGIYTLELQHRSVNLSVDKIVLKHETAPNATFAPEGMGPVETR